MRLLIKVIFKLKLPLYIRAIGGLASYFNPFTTLRIAGPYGRLFQLCIYH